MARDNNEGRDWDGCCHVGRTLSEIMGYCYCWLSWHNTVNGAGNYYVEVVSLLGN